MSTDSGSVAGRLSGPSPAWLVLAPALAFLTVFLVAPLAATLWLSLSPNVLVQFDGPGLDNFRYLFGKAYYADTVMRTLRISLAVTLISLVLGYMMALLVREFAARLGGVAIVGLTFPILTGPLVVALGWLILLSDGGPLLRPLIAAGWIQPLRLLGTETAVVIGLVHFTLPFTVLTLYASLREIPESLLEAARSLGAGPLAVFRRVIFPLSLPGVISATLLAFSLAASAYVAPHYLGGPTNLTLTTLVAQFILATFNSEMAAAASVLLLALMTVIIFGFSRASARFVRG